MGQGAGRIGADDDTRNALQQLARSQGRAVSNVVGDALSRYLPPAENRRSLRLVVSLKCRDSVAEPRLARLIGSRNGRWAGFERRCPRAERDAAILARSGADADMDSLARHAAATPMDDLD